METKESGPLDQLNTDIRKLVIISEFQTSMFIQTKKRRRTTKQQHKHINLRETSKIIRTIAIFLTRTKPRNI